jgi:chromosome partitioning protein
MIRTIAVTNQKGGCGKTTTTTNLSAALAEKGRRVLLIDLDPQFNLTSSVGIDPIENKIGTVYDLLMEPRKNIKELVIKTATPGLEIISSCLDLAGAEVQLPQTIGGERLLQEALSSLDGYDYIFIDCPPSLGRLTLNALSAATDILIPIQVGKWALTGTNQLFDTVELVRRRLNSHLGIIGILCTMYDSRTSLSKEILAQLKQRFPEQLFNTVIRMATILGEAAVANSPIIIYSKNSPAAEAYRQLAEEFEKRCQNNY